MESLRELYRIGTGPSSSHTMGPRTAALAFLAHCPQAEAYRITLYGSLASTGRGHLTDEVLKQVFDNRPLEIIWTPDIELPFHPNGMKFEALDSRGATTDERTVYSVGGGKITDETMAQQEINIYPHSTMAEILTHLEQSGQSIWEYVLETEPDLTPWLSKVWKAMTTNLATLRE